MMYSWWDGSAAPWYGMIFGPFAMIVLIAVTALLIVWVLGEGSLELQPGRKAKSALDVLKDRFARGEIDRAEYEERKRVLSNS